MSVTARLAWIVGMERWQGSQSDTEFHGAHTEFHGVVKQRSTRALRQTRKTLARSTDKNLLRETPCELRETLCRTAYFVGTATYGLTEHFPISSRNRAAQTNTT
jgi:hypothetical protein